MKNTLTIVMYHYVRPIDNSNFFNFKGLTLDKFEIQIEYIKNHYHVISMEDFVNAELAGEKLPKNSIVLSFDDGYIDHYNFVLPVLKKNKINGIFFPISDALINRNILDVNKIHFILDSLKDKNIKNEIYLLEKEMLCFMSRDKIAFIKNKFFKKNKYDSKEVNYFKRLLQFVLPSNLREKYVDNLFSKLVAKDEKDFADQLYMNSSHIKALKSEGMEIGCHGHQHLWLNKINKKKQEQDIVTSLKIIKSFLNIKDKLFFCFPYGGYNKYTIDILKKFKFSAAVTTKTSLVDQHINNFFELPRLDTNDLPSDRDLQDNKWFEKII